MDDTQTKLKRFEQWLVILRILGAVFLVAGIVFLYMFLKQNGHPGPMVICFLAALMFFMAYGEKSKGPRPGSPEYEALEHAHEAKIQASQEYHFRKQHPFMVARELVESNKTSTKTKTTIPGTGKKTTAADMNAAVSKKDQTKKTPETKH